MDSERKKPLPDEIQNQRISRREFLRLATLMGVSAPVAYVLAACGVPATPPVETVGGDEPRFDMVEGGAIIHFQEIAGYPVPGQNLGETDVKITYAAGVTPLIIRDANLNNGVWYPQPLAFTNGARTVRMVDELIESKIFRVIRNPQLDEGFAEWEPKPEIALRSTATYEGNVLERISGGEKEYYAIRIVAAPLSALGIFQPQEIIEYNGKSSGSPNNLVKFGMGIVVGELKPIADLNVSWELNVLGMEIDERAFVPVTP